MLASRPSGPRRAAASQGRLCVNSCAVGSPHPHPSAATQARARHPAGSAPLARRQWPRKRARRARRCLPVFRAHRCPPFPRKLAAGGLPRRRQPSTCEGTAPGPPPAPRGQESSHRCLEAVKVLPGQRGGTIWVGAGQGPRPRKEGKPRDLG